MKHFVKQTIIGIAGGTASGKTTIAKRLAEASKPYGSVTLIRLDDYYKDLSHLTLEERKRVNFDHPDAYDFALLIEHLSNLKDGLSINKPIYDFVEHNRSHNVELVNSSDVIIVEGLMLFAIPELLPFYDMKIYVDTADDIRFIRRLDRDIKHRGRTLDSVITQYLTTVRPMHLSFVEPSKRMADLIIPEGGYNEVAIDIILTKIQDLFHRNK